MHDSFYSLSLCVREWREVLLLTENEIYVKGWNLSESPYLKCDELAVERAFLQRCPVSSWVAGTGDHLHPPRMARVSSQEWNQNVATVLTKAWPDGWRCRLPQEQTGTEESGPSKSWRTPRSRCLAVCSVEKSRPRSSHWGEETGRERLLTPLGPTLHLLKPLSPLLGFLILQATCKWTWHQQPAPWIRADTRVPVPASWTFCTSTISWWHKFIVREFDNQLSKSEKELL